ncbi:hypothetical protein JCM18899A_23770 [Nocardioides sp. AN3]
MILLGYRDRNVHELICHQVAERAGYYERLGVEVKAVAGADHPEAPLSAGLGGSLIESLKGSRHWRAALVHTVHPMFWLWRRDSCPMTPPVVAAHPEESIVWAFTLRMLADQGVPSEGQTVLRFPVGLEGDRRRLQALTSGVAGIAALGSSFAPRALLRQGLRPVAYFGDQIRFPTAGIAVDVESDVDPQELDAVVAAQRSALALIRQADSVAADAMVDLMLDGSRADATHLLRGIVAAQYGPDAAVAHRVGEQARAWLAAHLGVDPSAASDFFAEVG